MKNVYLIIFQNKKANAVATTIEAYKVKSIADARLEELLSQGYTPLLTESKILSGDFTKIYGFVSDTEDRVKADELNEAFNLI